MNASNVACVSTPATRAENKYGKKMKIITMKKLLHLLLLICFGIMFNSCAKKDPHFTLAVWTPYTVYAAVSIDGVYVGSTGGGGGTGYEMTATVDGSISHKMTAKASQCACVGSGNTWAGDIAPTEGGITLTIELP